MPIISNLVYTTTDSTIVAVWNTDVAADSNLFATGKAAIDNGIAAASTSHQCIVVGLNPSTVYNCQVSSGGTFSSIQNITTNAAQTRVLVTTAKMGAVTLTNQANNEGDTNRTFLSSDNKVYITQDDGFGFQVGSHNSSYNTQIAALSDEAAFTGGASLLTNYGASNVSDGTDGISGASLSNKSSGLFGLNGNLHMFVYRQDSTTFLCNRYCNAIKSTNHGATWNNFTNTSNFVAGGVQVSPHSSSEPVQFTPFSAGLITPIRYAADDGTLGYNTAGNQIDGANAFVYCNALDLENSLGPYLMRIPRITFDSQTMAGTQYWHGPVSPSYQQFVTDSSWTPSSTGATLIWSGSAQVPGATTGTTNFPYGAQWQEITFIPGFNSYVLTATTHGNYMFQFYAAPTPAGPWVLVYTQVNNVTNKNWYGPFLFHRDVTSNAVTSNAAIKTLFNGQSVGAFYGVNLSTLTLNPTSGAAMTQLVGYDFTTVENPLSNGGNFTLPTAFTAGKVASARVFEATVAGSATCGEMWSGAVPPGDTGGTWPADQYCETTVATMVSGDLGLIRVRQSASANTAYQFIYAAVTAAPTSLGANLYGVVNGTATTLASPAMTIAANDVIRLSVTGNVLTVTQNGTVVNTTTDAGNLVPAAGNPAFALIIAGTITNSTLSLFAAGANQAAPPTFSPIAGSYSTSQTVTINGPASSTIFYTTDGSTPTHSSSTFATGGTVVVGTSKTLNAIASVTNFADSQIGSATYSIATIGDVVSEGGYAGKMFSSSWLPI